MRVGQGWGIPLTSRLETLDMRRPLTAALAALTLASSITTPTFADRHRHGRHHRHHDDGDAAAAAVVAGLVGLVIGAAVVADSRRRVLYQSVSTEPVLPPPGSVQPDAEGWYGPYADGSSQGCFMQRWVYDRELGRTTTERRPVDCLEAAR